MTTTNKIIKEAHGFKIAFNGSSTYWVEDANGDVWEREDTLRKITNRFKKILKLNGLN